MIYLAVTVILISVASAQECRPPPYRSDMSVIYGLGFVEFICNKHHGERSYLLKCVDGTWHGFVPESCDYVLPPVTARPTRPPPPPTVPSKPTRFMSKCGPAPYREEMLHYEGTNGNFVDYYCKPPRGGHYQPFAYRLICRFGHWMGELPSKCPQGVENYPRIL